MSEKTFLVEIGTEELPPKHYAAWLSPLLRTLLRSWITWPRTRHRSMVCCSASSGAEIANLAEAQPDREIEKRGPAIPRRSMPKVNRVKRQKVGRVVRYYR